MSSRGQTDGDESQGPGPLAGSGSVRQASEPRSEQSTISGIGPDIVVTGNVEAEVDLHIEGKVVGDVRCSTLLLGERSSVLGRIVARRVHVSGLVDGSIETTDLALEASARIKGEVTYSRLRIANGGIIEGNMIHVAPSDEAGGDGSRLKLVENETKSVYIE